MVDPFQQAEAQYRQLSSDLAAGRISVDQFRNLLSQIRVTDAQGRTWMLQEGSGQWYVWDNGQWQAASPYPATPSTPPPTPAPTMAPTQQPYQTGLPPLEGGWGRVFTGMLTTAIATVVIFGLIGLALVYFTDDFELGQMPKIMLLPAAISLIISLTNMSSQWRGRIEGFVDKRERRNTGDDDYTWETVRYARLRLENGKLKSVRPGRNWQVGDVIEKRRGDWAPKRLGQ